MGTSGTISPLSLSARGAAAHIAAGDYLADLQLAGRTVYAKAWTNVDGIAGYSVCDKLIGAVYEASGDAQLSAGDRVIGDAYPTTFDGPYAFGDSNLTETVVGVRTCTSNHVIVDLELSAVSEVIANEFGQAFLVYESDTSFLFVEDGTAGNAADIIHVVPGSVSLERTDNLEGSFIDASVTAACPA